MHAHRAFTEMPDSYFIDPTTRDYRSTCPTANGKNLNEWDAALADAKANGALDRWLERNPIVMPKHQRVPLLIVRPALADQPGTARVTNNGYPDPVLREMLREAIINDPRPLDRAVRAYWIDGHEPQPQFHQLDLDRDLSEDAVLGRHNQGRSCVVSLQTPMGSHKTPAATFTADVTTYPDDVHGLALRMHAWWMRPVHVTPDDTEAAVVEAKAATSTWATFTWVPRPAGEIDGTGWECVITDDASGRMATLNHAVVIDTMRQIVADRDKIDTWDSIIDTYAAILTADTNDTATGELEQLGRVGMDVLIQYIVLGDTR